MVHGVHKGKMRLLNFVRLCNKNFSALNYDERTRKFYFPKVKFDDHTLQVETTYIRLNGLLDYLKNAFYPYEDGADFRKNGRSSSTEIGKRVDNELNDYALCLSKKVSSDFTAGQVPTPEWLGDFSRDFYSKKRKLDVDIRAHLGFWRPFHAFTKRIIRYLAENGLYLLRTQIPVVSIERCILTYIDGIAFDLNSGKTFLLEVKTGFDRNYTTKINKNEPYMKYECIHAKEKNIVASERNKHQLQLGFMWALSGLVNLGEDPFDECLIILTNRKTSGVKVYKMDSWFKKDWVHLMESTGFKDLHCEICKSEEEKKASPCKQKKITEFFSTK